MTKEELALLLDGMKNFEGQLAVLSDLTRDSRLVAIYGIEGNIALCGFINKNVSYRAADLDADEDMAFMLHLGGVLPSWESILDERPHLEEAQEWFRRMEKAHLITRVWNYKRDYWRIETVLPHAKFVLKDFDGRPRGDGIVIDAKDL